MNSHLNRIALASNIRHLPSWKHKLADHIGAPAVFYRFNSAYLADGTMYVKNPTDLEWIKSKHGLELSRIFGINEIKPEEGICQRFQTSEPMKQ